MNSPFRLPFVLCALVVLVMAVVSVMTNEAPAHSFYEAACCSNQDCSPVSNSYARATAAGWYIPSRDETVAYDSTKIRMSPDGKFHACILKNTKALLCLYVPGMTG